jgi:hypothetical protein
LLPNRLEFNPRLKAVVQVVFESLNSHGVDYLVVGAHALAFHGRPRYTGDIDLWLRPTHENAARVEQVLVEFRFAGLRAADFMRPESIVHLGVAPNRIDLLTSLTGVTFDEAWDKCVPGELGGVPVAFLSREILIKNQRATGRTQYAAGVEASQT